MRRGMDKGEGMVCEWWAGNQLKIKNISDEGFLGICRRRTVVEVKTSGIQWRQILLKCQSGCTRLAMSDDQADCDAPELYLAWGHKRTESVE